MCVLVYFFVDNYQMKGTHRSPGQSRRPNSQPWERIFVTCAESGAERPKRREVKQHAVVWVETPSFFERTCCTPGNCPRFLFNMRVIINHMYFAL